MAAILRTLTRQETWDLYNQIKDVDSETLKAAIEKALLEHKASMDSISIESMTLAGYSGSDEESAHDPENSSQTVIVDSNDNIDLGGEVDKNNQSIVSDDNDLRFNPETGEFELVTQSKGLMDSIAKYFDLNLKLKYILKGVRTLSDPSSGFLDVISIVAPAIAQQYAGIPALIIVAAVTVFCRNSISGTNFNY